MTFRHAIDLYIRDMRAEGRLNSEKSERTYRDVLNLHAGDVANRDPRTTNRLDVKRTLARWKNPNTVRGRRATLVSFYDWCMEEGHRKDNPARQTRRPRKRPTNVYKLTRSEAAALLQAASGPLERRAIFIGICGGLRSAELRGLQGRHFQRPGFIWVSADIAKGGRERFVPVIPELEPIVSEILANVTDSEFVLHGQRNANPPLNTIRHADPWRPMGATTLYRLVGNVAKRAGIAEDIHPHLMRHAYGDHVARHAGLKLAQALLGHADVSTTQGYTDKPTLDDLQSAVSRLVFGYPPGEQAGRALVETAGFEPATSTFRSVEPNLERWIKGVTRRAVAVYVPHFRGEEN